MERYELIWQANPTAVILVTLAAVATAVLFYRRVFRELPPRRAALLLGLRLAALLLLLVLLFKPALSYSRPPQDQSRIVLAVDTSRSMSVADARGRPRLDYLKSFLAENLDLLRDQPSAAAIRVDDSAEPVRLDDLDDLAPGGPTTNLSAAFDRLPALVPADQLQAMIVMTDGNDLSGKDVAQAVEVLSRPVYFIAVGDEATASALPNLALTLVDPPIRLTAGGENDLAAQVQWSGSFDAPAELRTELADVSPPAARVATEGPTGQKQLRVTLKPKSPGKTEAEFALAPPTNAAEASDQDNAQRRHFLAVKEKLRVLIVEGRLRPEYRFLRQFLESEPAVEFVSFVQVRPGKFLVSASPDLEKPEQIWSQKSDYENFDVIVIGDISTRTLTDEQFAFIRQAVEGGKALLVIAGGDTHQLARTPLADILAISPTEKVEWSKQDLRPALSAAGRANPAFEALADFLSPTAPQNADAKLDGFFRIGSPTPATTVLLETPNADPLLAMRNVGCGKSAILATESTWNWALSPQPAVTEQLYRGFWGGLLRHLAGREVAGDQPPQLILNPSSSWTTAGQALALVCHVFDLQAHATTQPAVQLRITGPHDIPPAAMKPADDHYLCPLTLEQPGRYLVEATARFQDRDLTDQQTIDVLEIDEELARVALNRQNLHRWAQAGNTEQPLSPEDLGPLLRRLKSEYLQRAQTQREFGQWRSFDHRNPMLAAFIALLIGEWILRRTWQLR
ncbi:MAG: hypothetical protein GXY33_08060 [Phycisphaerae bacterium]|nr:hypothetical protein [Phycisphaerae bacterium]